METKHTKEKLEIHKDQFDNFNITSNGYYIGEMRNEADAKKVIAAPDLLEALQSALPYLHKETRIKAEQAIKKATE